MSFDPDRHHRQSIRLKGYDYSRPGMYYVTICTQDRVCSFGEVSEDQILTLGQIVARFKYMTTKSINEKHGTPGKKFFQRGYYDRIIRSKTSLDRARKYISENPANWASDKLNPEN